MVCILAYKGDRNDKWGKAPRGKREELMANDKT